MFRIRGSTLPFATRGLRLTSSTAVALCLLIGSAAAWTACSGPTVLARPKVRWRTVARVVDGDTVVLDRGEKVRLIGVDTPETVDPRRPVQRFGTEASFFTARLVFGKRVRLEYDYTRRDRYGRTLAYMFLEDGTFVNAEIVKQGYGFAYTKYPFRYMEEFRQYERLARRSGRGLWAER